MKREKETEREVIRRRNNNRLINHFVRYSVIIYAEKATYLSSDPRGRTSTMLVLELFPPPFDAHDAPASVENAAAADRPGRPAARPAPPRPATFARLSRESVESEKRTRRPPPLPASAAALFVAAASVIGAGTTVAAAALTSLKYYIIIY